MTATHPTHAEATSDAAVRTDELVESVVRRHRIPGLSLAVVRASGLLHTRGYGSCDLATGDPATPATSYLWFSLTKIATATAARLLADQGRLDLTAPVTDHLDLGRRWSGRVPTVGQLLNHTAGFANPLPTRWVRPAATPEEDPGQLLRRLLARHPAPRHPVGDEAHYSNLGYLVLGEVISSAAGQPFTEHLVDAVLRPLGMDQTGFAHQAGAAAATPYVRVPRPGRPLLGVLFPRRVIGARVGRYVALEPFYVEGASYGGLVGTVVDAGRFASMHLADGRPLLEPASAREMRTITATGSRDFGQGWFRDGRHRELRPGYVEHLGAGGGFYNAMRIYPDLDLGIVSMANTTAAYDHHELFTEIARLRWR